MDSFRFGRVQGRGAAAEYSSGCYHFARMPSPLTALSPLDGRYAAKTRALQDHFSEFALMRERVAIEVAWLQALARDDSFAALAPFSPATVAELERSAAAFGLADAERIKAIEATTNH